MKIKEQTRKLAAGCSKHCIEVVDKTDEVSSKHCFEVADGTWRGLKRFSKSIIRKSPVPQTEEQGFLSFNYSSVPRKFFATRAARTPPTIGARMKIHTCWRAAPPTKTAGAKLRAGFTERPVMFKPTRIMAINDKPITKPAIAPLPLLADVTVMITRTNKKVAITSNKKPPKTVTPFAKAFSPRLAVDMPELDKRKNTAADARKAPTTCPRM